MSHATELRRIINYIEFKDYVGKLACEKESILEQIQDTFDLLFGIFYCYLLVSN
jgi:hypothetical protein